MMKQAKYWSKVLHLCARFEPSDVLANVEDKLFSECQEYFNGLKELSEIIGDELDVFIPLLGVSKSSENYENSWKVFQEYIVNTRIPFERVEARIINPKYDYDYAGIGTFTLRPVSIVEFLDMVRAILPDTNSWGEIKSITFNDDSSVKTLVVDVVC
jgi:hypothetical protein